MWPIAHISEKNNCPDLGAGRAWQGAGDGWQGQLMLAEQNQGLRLARYYTGKPLTLCV